MRVAVYPNDLAELFTFEGEELSTLARLVHIEEGGTVGVEEIEQAFLDKMQFVGQQYYYWLIDCPNCKERRDDACRCGWTFGAPLDEDEERCGSYESCPGCGCMPGDGLTEHCNDELGCGYWRKEHLPPDTTKMTAVFVTRDTAQSIERAIIELMDKRDRKDEEYWEGLERALVALKESFKDL